MGYIGEDITDGRWQKIEYDNIPDYCFYCKHQGHLETDCTIRQRDEDKKKKEMENVRNKNNRDAGKNSQQPKGHTEEEQQETNNQQNKQQRDPEQIQLQQEEHWQTQRRKNTNQMQVPRGTTSHADQNTKQAGNSTIPTQNTYINLDGQETPQGLEVRDKHKGNSSARIPQTSVQKQ
uniref:CCHC-type domain-containing protein n=1 Tax=Solanum tuberosum TaxID=4113 RepID=M1DUW5_SOLTU